jgi:mono/diheme cytochrome c family protein
MRQLLTALALFGFSGIGALAQGTGPFSQTQVAAGHKNYQTYCAGCHGEDLAGGGDVTPLTGSLL